MRCSYNLRALHLCLRAACPLSTASRVFGPTPGSVLAQTSIALTRRSNCNTSSNALGHKQTRHHAPQGSPELTKRITSSTRTLAATHTPACHAPELQRLSIDWDVVLRSTQHNASPAMLERGLRTRNSLQRLLRRLPVGHTDTLLYVNELPPLLKKDLVRLAIARQRSLSEPVATTTRPASSSAKTEEGADADGAEKRAATTSSTIAGHERVLDDAKDDALVTLHAPQPRLSTTVVDNLIAAMRRRSHRAALSFAEQPHTASDTRGMPECEEATLIMPDTRGTFTSLGVRVHHLGKASATVQLSTLSTSHSADYRTLAQVYTVLVPQNLQQRDTRKQKQQSRKQASGNCDAIDATGAQSDVHSLSAALRYDAEVSRLVLSPDCPDGTIFLEGYHFSPTHAVAMAYTACPNKPDKSTHHMCVSYGRNKDSTTTTNTTTNSNNTDDLSKDVCWRSKRTTVADVYDIFFMIRTTDDATAPTRATKLNDCAAYHPSLFRVSAVDVAVIRPRGSAALAQGCLEVLPMACTRLRFDTSSTDGHLWSAQVTTSTSNSNMNESNLVKDNFSGDINTSRNTSSSGVSVVAMSYAQALQCAFAVGQTGKPAAPARLERPPCESQSTPSGVHAPRSIRREYCAFTVVQFVGPVNDAAHTHHSASAVRNEVGDDNVLVDALVRTLSGRGVSMRQKPHVRHAAIDTLSPLTHAQTDPSTEAATRIARTHQRASQAEMLSDSSVHAESGALLGRLGVARHALDDLATARERVLLPWLRRYSCAAGMKSETLQQDTQQSDKQEYATKTKAEESRTAACPPLWQFSLPLLWSRSNLESVLHWRSDVRRRLSARYGPFHALLTPELVTTLSCPMSTRAGAEVDRLLLVHDEAFVESILLPAMRYFAHHCINTNNSSSGNNSNSNTNKNNMSKSSCSTVGEPINSSCRCVRLHVTACDAYSKTSVPSQAHFPESYMTGTEQRATQQHCSRLQQWFEDYCAKEVAATAHEVGNYSTCRDFGSRCRHRRRAAKRKSNAASGGGGGKDNLTTEAICANTIRHSLSHRFSPQCRAMTDLSRAFFAQCQRQTQLHRPCFLVVPIIPFLEWAQCVPLLHTHVTDSARRADINTAMLSGVQNSALVPEEGREGITRAFCTSDLLRCLQYFLCYETYFELAAGDGTTVGVLDTSF